MYSDRRRSVCRPIVVAVCISAATTSALAAPATWIGNTDASLGTAANWNALPVSGDSWTFNAPGTAGATLTNNLTTSAFNVAGITFTSSATSVYTVSGGTFALTGNIALQSAFSQTIGSNIAVSGSRTVSMVNGSSLTLSGNLSGSGTLSQTGAGSGAVSNFILSGTNSGFTGAFLADNSNSTRTAFSNPDAGSASAAWTFNRTVNGGVALNFTSSTIAFGALSGGAFIRSNNTGTVTVRVGDLNTSSTFSGILQQANAGALLSLLKVGSGTLSLSGASTYTAPTTISDGVLAATALANGGVASPLGQSSNSAANLVLNGGALRYTGAAVTTDRLFSIGTAGGTLEANGSGAVVFSSTGALGFNGQSGARTLTLSGTNSGDNTLAAILGDSGGATSLVKAGSGKWVLTGAHTYTGATTVDSGTLAVNGSLGATAVSVAAAAWLQGTGTIGGSVNVLGTLSPGSSPGVIALGSLALGGSSTTLIEINGTGRGTSYDGIDITGSDALTYGGLLSLSFGTSLADQSVLDIFAFNGSASGDFSSVVSTGVYAGTWTNNNDGTFSFAQGSQTLTFQQATGDIIVVPEPGAMALAGMGIALACWSRWNRRHTSRKQSGSRPTHHGGS